MINSIFIFDFLTKEKIDIVSELRFSTIFTNSKNISKESIQYAHLKNIKINVEIVCFAGKERWQKYPNSRPVNQSGKSIELINWYAGVCPNNPQIRRETLNHINKIIKEYDINGIWLDFCRYPCHWEDVRSSTVTEYCFCKNCLSKYKHDVGEKPEGNTWIDWKCAQITEFVKEVRQNITSSSKEITLGLFSVPWKDTDYNDSIRKIIGQDLHELAPFIDKFSPMTFHRFTGNSPQWMHEIVQYVNNITRKKVLPLVQTEDRVGKITKNEFQQTLFHANQSPSQGVIVFFLEDLLKDKSKINILKEYNT